MAGVWYLKGKPYYQLFERSCETRQSFAMEGFRQVLVEKVLNKTTSTKTYLEPSTAKIRRVSKLLELLGNRTFF